MGGQAVSHAQNERRLKAAEDRSEQDQLADARVHWQRGQRCAQWRQHLPLPFLLICSRRRGDAIWLSGRPDQPQPFQDP
jgi:hypothetical protein